MTKVAGHLMRMSSFILAVFLVVATIFIVMAYVSSHTSASLSQTWTAMEGFPFDCPAGTEKLVDRWSESGYSRRCVSLKDGPWEAWSNGYLQISGGYRGGKQHGRWLYYNADGSISRVIDYQDGLEIPNAAVR